MNPCAGPWKPTSPIMPVKAFAPGVTSSASSGFDANAAAFFAAAGITDGTQKTAINTLVLALKSYSIWTKLYALYPFVGGAASPHSYNLVNPALYQISWTGGITHDGNGITGNGTTGFGNTGFNASTNGFSSTAGGLGVYIRNNTASGYDMGSSDSAISKCTDLSARYTGGTSYFGFHGSNGSSVSTTNTDSRGLHVMQRSAGNIELYRNGSSVASSAVMFSGLSTNAVYICGENRGGSAIEFSNHNYGAALIHDTLTAQNNTDLYTAIQAYETALSRNV